MKMIVRGLLTLLIPVFVSAQKDLPSVSLRSNGEGDINIKSLCDTATRPIIISFWATWCGPCLNELDAISEAYEEWQAATGVQLIAVSIDDARSSGRAASLAAGKGWSYTILFDENQELKRGLNIANVPATLVIYKGKVIYSHNSYHPGDEAELLSVIEKAVNKS
jgi:thiol-disulfide isomerase/thioredoxin